MYQLPEERAVYKAAIIWGIKHCLKTESYSLITFLKWVAPSWHFSNGTKVSSLNYGCIKFWIRRVHTLPAEKPETFYRIAMFLYHIELFVPESLQLEIAHELHL